MKETIFEMLTNWEKTANFWASQKNQNIIPLIKVSLQQIISE